jgi:hypothetical protein
MKSESMLIRSWDSHYFPLKHWKFLETQHSVITQINIVMKIRSKMSATMMMSWKELYQHGRNNVRLLNRLY